ncbi:MAG TPA: SDR family NAD(P)-dependent oxidoreductase [Candidatus Dormibacteraeota bacterium]|nr:SDR family NAD(P)-dependent oxidoreductase [Candidatus Dormibacteraeota bacterium]
MGLLDGKVAAVTGAGRGIGRAYALALAAEGAAVVVNDVGLELVGGEGGRGLVGGAPQREVAQSVADEITARGGRAVADSSDVSSVAGGRRVVETALEAFGDIDVVVNNAGTWIETDVDDVDDARFDSLFGVHLKGTVGTTAAAFDAMKRAGHGGRIINNGAPALMGPVQTPGLAVYSTAKSAVAAYTYQAAGAGAPFGICVNTVIPMAITRQSRVWFFRTGLVNAGDAATIAHLSPERNAPLVVFLASDAAAGITGRFFSISPAGLSAGAQFAIAETVCVPGTSALSDEWTPSSVQAAFEQSLGMHGAQFAMPGFAAATSS